MSADLTVPSPRKVGPKIAVFRGIGKEEKASGGTPAIV
jgi:hypothetical protein